MLKQTIEESGLRVEYLANKCNISKQAFYNKLNGKSDFSAEEVGVMRKVLRLDMNQIVDIFLS